MAVSIRVSPQMKRRVAQLAARAETTAHAFMLAAIEEKVAAEEARAAFVAEAEGRLRKMKRTGKGVLAADAFQYLEALARGEKVRPPVAQKLT